MRLLTCVGLTLLTHALIVLPVEAVSLSAERLISEPRIGPAAMFQGPPLVASNGVDFLTVWQDDRYADPIGTIRYTLVRRGETVASPEGVSIPIDVTKYGGATDFIPGDSPAALCRMGNEYLLFTWEARAIRIDDEGEVTSSVDRSEIHGDGRFWHPEGFACDGRTVLALYRNLEAPAAQQHQAIALDADLRVLGAFSIPMGLGFEGHIDLASSPAGGYLVVWGATRPDNNAVHAVRISSEGGLLDASPITLPTTNPSEDVWASANEDTWLIAGTDIYAPCTYVATLNRNGSIRMPLACALNDGFAWKPIPTPDGFLIPLTIGDDDDLAMLSVSRDGRFVAPAPRSFCAAPGDQWAPAGTSSGDRTLVAWIDTRRRASADIFFGSATFAGDPLDLEGLGAPISISAETQHPGALARSGSQYLAAWIAEPKRGLTEIRAGRLDQNGAPLDGSGIRLDTSSTTKMDLDAVFDGQNFVIVWRELGGECRSRLRAARISPAGKALDPIPMEVSGCSGQSASRVKAASNGSGTMVLFNGSDMAGTPEMRVSRISLSGAVLDPGGRALPLNEYCGNIASDGTNFMLTCSNRTVVVLTADGTVQSVNVNDYSLGPIAWGGDRYLGLSGSSGTLKAILLDRTGKRISDGPDLGRSDWNNGNGDVSVAFDGQHFVVAFERQTRSVIPATPIDPFVPAIFDIYLRSITLEGLPMQSAPVPVSTTYYEDDSPSVAGINGRALVLYARRAPDVTGVRRIFGKIVSPSAPRTRPAQR